MKHAQDMSAAKNVKAWALASNGEQAGTVVACWGKGTATGNHVTVTVSEWGKERRTGKAHGGGYDMIGGALESMFYKKSMAAANLFGAGQIEEGFKLLGFDLWRVL